MFEALDAGDAEAMRASLADDVTGLDEVSRSWMSGRQELSDHVEKLVSSVSGIKSDLQDVRTKVLDDAAIVVCRLEQDYSYNGMQHHISAPTTAVLKKEEGVWKITHFHSAPIPE